MKISLLLSLIAGSVQVGWGRFNVELEGALAGCDFTNQTDKPFVSKDRASLATPEQALHSDWQDYPSSDIDFKALIRNPNLKKFEYRNPLCEGALELAIQKTNQLTDSETREILRARCKSLQDDSNYADDAKHRESRWQRDHPAPTTHTATTSYWCDDSDSRRNSSVYIQIACESLDARHDSKDRKSQNFKDAISYLGDNCGTPDRPRHSSVSHRDRDRDRDDDDYYDRDDDDDRYLAEDDDGFVRRRHRRLPGDQNVHVVSRIIQIPYRGAGGGCNGGSRVLKIEPPGGALYTLANAGIAGLGAVLSYAGQRHADDLRAKVTLATLKQYDKLGLAGGLSVSGSNFLGQGGAYGLNGAGVLQGGVCGSPPYNTAYVGCAGGLPGQFPVGVGNCPTCNLYGNGFRAPCPAGVACPGGTSGNYGPYGYNPYLGAAQARPYGFAGQQSPFNLAAENQRLADLQNQLNAQKNAASQLGTLSSKLYTVDQQRNQLLNSLQGYNGILANSYGPGGYYGNAGVYNGGGLVNGGYAPGGYVNSGLLNQGAINPGYINGGFQNASIINPGIINSGITGGCGTPACYPGNAGAYYYPPNIVGNSGFGSSALGYPDRNTINFGFGTNWTGVTPRTNNTESAR